MSRTSDAQKAGRRPRRGSSPQPRPARPGSGRPPAASAVPSGSRRRGALLRRLLALGDWVALIGSLFVVTATTSTTDVATLFWAVLFSPIWILVVKLHGLYDNDHRRIRHSTLDELPSLVSASVLGTLVLDGLLALSPVGPLSPASAIGVGIGTLVGSFVLRGVLRFFWHRLTGARGRDRDRPGGGRRHRRPAGLDPPRDAPAAGRLPLLRERRHRDASSRGWARSPTSPGSPASTRSSGSSSPNRR